MSNAHKVILEPVVTEFSTDLSRTQNKYTFKVAMDANKIQIKDAVEELFSVKVNKVNTAVRRGKPRRYRWVFGKLPNWKKAVVTLKEGDKIDFL
jgi:large subunit ribosomal protein L23